MPYVRGLVCHCLMSDGWFATAFHTRTNMPVYTEACEAIHRRLRLLDRQLRHILSVCICRQRRPRPCPQRMKTSRTRTRRRRRPRLTSAPRQQHSNGRTSSRRGDRGTSLDEKQPRRRCGGWTRGGNGLAPPRQRGSPHCARACRCAVAPNACSPVPAGTCIPCCAPPREGFTAVEWLLQHAALSAASAWPLWPAPCLHLGAFTPDEGDGEPLQHLSTFDTFDHANMCSA